MGRFYTGDIEGKFWFGVQDSDDVEKLVNITGYTYYSWNVCHCTAEMDEDYCKQCYDSKEEHIEAAIEEESYEDKCLYYEDCCNGYSLDKETHYQELVDNMNELKTKINKNVIHAFDKIEQNDKILDAFTGVFDNTHKYLNTMENNPERKEQEVLTARYTLGYQIEYCIRTTGSCNINCEY